MPILASAANYNALLHTETGVLFLWQQVLVPASRVSHISLGWLLTSHHHQDSGMVRPANTSWHHHAVCSHCASSKTRGAMLDKQRDFDFQVCLMQQICPVWLYSYSMLHVTYSQCCIMSYMLWLSNIHCGFQLLWCMLSLLHCRSAPAL